MQATSLRSRLDRYRFGLMAGAVWLACMAAGGRAAPPALDEAPVQPADPIGQFLSISGPIDDTVFGRVSRVALALQARAQQEKRPGVLVLEIGPGTSQFHQVQGLAKFIATDLPSLTTVAWVPASVRGNHVVLALACREILMRPDAELGDLGLGRALDADEQAFVINLISRRHNRQLSPALVLGLMDPQKEVIWVKLETGHKPDAVVETRVVTPSEFDRLLKSKTVILDHKTLKEAGVDGVLTGDAARAANVLVMHLAQSRDEVAALYHLPREALRESRALGAVPKAVVIQIDAAIEPILEQFVQRQIQRAVGEGANVLIFEIDSPGGRLDSTMNLANSIVDLDPKQVRTVAYIPKQAFSGAAIISLACDEIYLHPHAMFGDAGPIEIRPGGPAERAPEKILSVLKGFLKTLAERKGRPIGLAQAMADRNLDVFKVTHRDNGQVWFMTEHEIHESNGQWIKGQVVPESGKEMLLTVDGRRAHELHLAEPAVTDFDDLKKRLGIPPTVPVRTSSRTWVDSLIFQLNTPELTLLLFVVGILCIYFELHFPTGLFGICSGLCFSIFFWSRFLGGTAGWLEVVLFLLGAAFIALEVFVVPGFGVFGVSGALLMLFSLILASQTFVLPATAEDFSQLSRSVGTLGGAVVGVAVIVALLSRYMPILPLFNRMILTPPGAEFVGDEPRLNPSHSGGAAVNPLLERDQALVGRIGTAFTVLRPAGKAQIDEELVDVVSEGPFISAGRPIEVVTVSGNRVVVRETT